MDSKHISDRNKPTEIDRERCYRLAKHLRKGYRELVRQMNTKRAKKTR